MYIRKKVAFLLLTIIFAINISVAPLIYASSNTYPDVTDASLDKTVSLLSALGIMQGVSDGNFKPDDKLTRGELADIILRMLNFTPDSMVSGKVHEFYDVKESAPLYKIIAAVDALGIIEGYNDNTFRPEQPVIVGDAVQMLLKSMGYATLADQKGGDSIGYLSIATSLGLINGLGISTDSELSRGNAAKLIFGCLKAPIFKQIRFGTKNEFNTDKNISMLSEYHDIYKDEGKVLGTNITSLVESKTLKDQILIDNTTFNIKNSLYNDLIGYKVEFYYKENKTGNNDLIYMCKQDNVDEIDINSEDVIFFDNNVLSYSLSENSKIEKEKISLVHDIILNGKRIINYDKSIFLQKTGSITLVSNNTSDEYDLININTFVNVVVSAVSFDNNIVNILPSYNLKRIKIDIANKDMHFEVVDPDGKKLTVDDLTSLSPNSLLSIYTDVCETINGYTVPSNDAKYYKIIICTNSIAGKLTEKNASDNSMTIDDKEFKVSSSNFLNENNNKADIGLKGTFYLDNDGKIASWIKDNANSSELVYGYLIRAAQDKSIDKTLQLKILTMSGDIKVFNCKKKFLLNEKAPKSTDIAIASLQSSAKMIDIDMTGVSQLIKYMTNSDGNISEIETVLADVGLPEGVDEDHLHRDGLRESLFRRNDNGGSLYYYDGIVKYNNPKFIFNVPITETENDEDYGVNGTWKNYDPNIVDIFDCSLVKEPNVCIVYKPAADVILCGCVMVNKVAQAIDKDGASVSKLIGLSGKGTASFLGNTTDLFNDLKQGDLVTVYGRNGVATRYFKLLSMDTLRDSSTIESMNVPVSVDYLTGIGEVYAAEYTKLLIQGGNIIESADNKPNPEGKRETQRVVNWGGTVLEATLIYDATDSKTNPTMTIATPSDIKTVYADGSKNASIIWTGESNHCLYVLVIYNGLR